MDAITFHGPVAGPTGYDAVVRYLGQELEFRGVQVCVTAKADWCPVTAELPLQKVEMIRRWVHRPSMGEIVVHVCLPTQVQLNPGKINVCFTMYESQTFPKAWDSVLRVIDYIVVPTEHCRRGFLEHGFSEERVFVVPLGSVSLPKGYEFKPTTFSVERNGRLCANVPVPRKRFLAIGEWVARRQYMRLIEAYLTAFKSGWDDVGLYLRTNSYGSDQLAGLWSKVAKARALLRSTAPIYLISSRLSEEDLLALYTWATHYVSFSAGEGWDLSCAQAAACGLELIVPQHTAYREYLSDKEAHFVPAARQATIQADLGLDSIYGRDALWTIPDFGVFVDRLQTADRLVRKGPAAAEHMANSYSWSSSAERFLEVMELING